MLYGYIIFNLILILFFFKFFNISYSGFVIIISFKCPCDILTGAIGDCIIKGCINLIWYINITSYKSVIFI